MRALYTAASGMNAQQANIDNVAHNLANVNTTGFKKSRVDFEDLVYQQMKAPGTPTSQEAEAPIGLESGLGTRAVATVAQLQRRQPAHDEQPARPRDRRHGLLPGLAARRRNGYTRAGTLHLERQGQIVTAEGITLEPQITIPSNALVDQRVEGRHRVGGAADRARRSRSAPSSWRMFQNPAGLQARGGNIFVATSASGDPTTGVPGTDGMRHARAGLPRGLERQRRRGDGPHDSRAARLRGELACHPRGGRDAAAGQSAWPARF